MQQLHSFQNKLVKTTYYYLKEKIVQLYWEPKPKLWWHITHDKKPDITQKGILSWKLQLTTPKDYTQNWSNMVYATTYININILNCVFVQLTKPKNIRRILFSIGVFIKIDDL